MNNNLSIIAQPKTNKEVIQELVDLIFEAISNERGANMVMLRPALNVVKLKMSQMDEEASADLIDKVHFISNHIEKQTGVLSRYHGIE